MLEAAESAAGPVLPVVDRWRLRDVEYSAVFSDGLDPDPAVVNAIRAFDPEYVPLLVRREALKEMPANLVMLKQRLETTAE